MLVVSVEVWPGGSLRRRRCIGDINIVNVSDLLDISDYEVYVDGLRRPDVIGHRRDDGWEPLVRRALGG